ncbi:MAG: hypothetical protein JWN14_4176 [Chthonomonadales bacterium]|nr:hypothetical protein [Chthonomonadales bacterium]
MLLIYRISEPTQSSLRLQGILPWHPYKQSAVRAFSFVGRQILLCLSKQYSERERVTPLSPPASGGRSCCLFAQPSLIARNKDSLALRLCAAEKVLAPSPLEILCEILCAEEILCEMLRAEAKHLESPPFRSAGFGISSASGFGVPHSGFLSEA